MRKFLIFFIAFVVMVCSGDASDVPKKIVITNKKAKMFKNNVHEPGEKPLYVAEKGEWFEVVEHKSDVFSLYLHVKNKFGIEGWIKKDLLDKPSEQTKKIIMNEAKILGYLENPQAVYILDISDPEFKPIKLVYSFKDVLITDIDREKFKRLYDVSMKAEE